MKKKIHEKYIGEASYYLDVWQGKTGDHKSSLQVKNDGVYVLGNIPHNAKLMFSRSDVPKIIKLLKMKDSPLVKEDEGEME